MKPIKSDTGEGPQSVTSILPLIETRPSLKICSRKKMQFYYWTWKLTLQSWHKAGGHAFRKHTLIWANDKTYRARSPSAEWLPGERGTMKDSFLGSETLPSARVK